MSAIEGRTGSALIVIDVQKGVMGGSIRSAEVIGAIASLVDRARVEGVPVIWVQHNSEELENGSAPWEIVDELSPGNAEPVVQKRHGDSFEGTELESILDQIGVGRLVVTGAQTDACVRSTIHGGFARGYDVTLVSDAHTTEDLSEWGAPPPEQVIDHTNLYWGFQSGEGKTADVAASSDVVLAGG